MTKHWSKSALLLAIILALSGVVGQGVRWLVWGAADSGDPDQVPLPVVVDEALYSSGNPDFAGVEGPAAHLGEAVDDLVEDQRAVITDPNVPIKPGGQNVLEIVEQDFKRREEAKKQLTLAEDQLAQRLINEIIEQETVYYVGLLEQVITTLRATQSSWEQVRRGLRHVNSQTAVNKG